MNEKLHIRNNRGNFERADGVTLIDMDVSNSYHAMIFSGPVLLFLMPTGRPGIVFKNFNTENSI